MITSQLIILNQDLINSIAETVTGDKNVRHCKKNLYAGPTLAQTF